MLKLKLQYFSHLMQRANLLEKSLMLGKIEGKRRRGQQRMRWLDGIINSLALSLLYGPALTFIHDYWNNHSFDFADLCRHGSVFPPSSRGCKSKIEVLAELVPLRAWGGIRSMLLT